MLFLYNRPVIEEDVSEQTLSGLGVAEYPILLLIFLELIRYVLACCNVIQVRRHFLEIPDCT